MADIHIDEFYHDCAKSLVFLYNSFPRRVTLYVDDLISDSGTDEYGIPTRRHKACFDTLLWLSAEGYLHYQDRIRQDALDQVVLTEKSFLRLSLPVLEIKPDNPVPSLIARKQATRAWQLREAINQGSSEPINQACQAFFTGSAICKTVPFNSNNP